MLTRRVATRLFPLPFLKILRLWRFLVRIRLVVTINLRLWSIPLGIRLLLLFLVTILRQRRILLKSHPYLLRVLVL